MNFLCRAVSSLEKIFGEDPCIKGDTYKGGSALQGEVYSFQLAYRSEHWGPFWGKIEIESELKEFITLREVAMAPAEHLAYDWLRADAVIKTTPGLYPDILLPIGEKYKFPIRQSRSLWVTLEIPIDCKPGKYSVKFTFKHTEEMPPEEPEVFGECAVNIEVLDAKLPPQQLIHTEWFHTDCLYSYYQVECWSDEHWNLISKYMKSAVKHGINMILTPLWTPPLDTAVGGERPTVQLLEISEKDGKYEFDFSRLAKWIEVAKRVGVEYFEMSHFFSQWGAKFSPKIIVNGEKRFFWHTEALSDEYQDFLKQLIPQLTAFLAGKNLQKQCYFHISDEPSLEMLDNYKDAAELVTNLLGDLEAWPIIDALSSPEYYDMGIIKQPIPGNNHLDAFYERQVKPLWTYYCVGQQSAVPNRFFNFPSSRNRIMGILMYRYGVDGFLQWGFNFWYSQYSLDQHLDPFRVTDAGRAFCSGDSYMVYPGSEGPIDSLHYEVFREGLQDMRALQGLERKIGREKVLAMLEENLGYQLTMFEYPLEPGWLLELRNRINHALAE